MCYKEFIAYQCGHRSIGVVRPCPMATAGHNFPVCSILPDKPHYAETMCAACERQLHSRWVLIREWEHRWLHERGVCGCEVTFPGLLHTPRVIGETSVAGSASAPDTASPDNPEGCETPSAPKTITAAAEDSNHRQPEFGQGDIEKTAGGRIPAIFSEELTESGQHRVTIRLPGLYGAEWQADHRAVHGAEKCSCPTSFAPFQPQVPDDELTRRDQKSLHQWRELEAEKERNKDNGRDIDDQGDETTRRLAEIEKTFGKFKVENDQPNAELPQTAATAVAENRSVEVRSNGNGWPFNRRLHENRRERGMAALPQKTPRQTHNSAQRHGQGQGGQLVLASQATTPFHHAYPNPHHPYQQLVFNPFNDQQAHHLQLIPTATGMGYVFPEYPPHQHAHYFAPAYPTYATHATYTDTVPHGAYPWAAETQPTPGMPWLTQGPGPYRTPGLSYANIGTQAGNTSRQDQSQGHSQGGQGRQQLPDAATNSNAKDKAIVPEQAALAHHHQHPDHTPLCGLPIGAGPEGTSHMPSWLGCRLRRSSNTSAAASSSSSADRLQIAGTKDGQGAHEEQVTMDMATGQRVVKADNTRVNGEQQEDADGGDGSEAEGDGGDEERQGEDGKLLPPTPPQRRHSTAT